MNMIRRFSLMGLTLGLWLSTMIPAHAFKLNPISRVFSPAGAEATQSYEIENTTKEIIAVEISTAKREMDLQGSETLTPADDDFMIYPPQVLLKPGESQTVRVTWLGDPQPDRELAYRLMATQLPVDVDKPQNQVKPKQSKGSVKLSMNYQGSLYVRPAQATAEVMIDRIETKMNGQQAMVAITLYNKGNSRAVLKDASLSLMSGGQSTTLTLTETDLNSNPILLSEHKRQILIPYPAGFAQGQLTGNLTLGKQPK